MSLGIKYHDSIYYPLSELGMLGTEDHYIKKYRNNSNENYYDYIQLSRGSIDGIQYKNPHFLMDTNKIDSCEFWVNDIHINSKTITWITMDYGTYGILPIDIDITIHPTILVHYNPYIVYHNAIYNNDGTTTPFIIQIDIRNKPYQLLENPDKSGYYISNNMIILPKVTWLNEYTIQFELPSVSNNAEFFICTNIIGAYTATANIGCFIDNLYSTKCYHDIVVDHDPYYTIDTRFYPCVKVDKDCVIRVYNTSYHTIHDPISSRLLNYDEFINITDPYNTENTYLNSLVSCDDEINEYDNEETQQTKFNHISAFCYRIWENFGFNENHQKNFLSYTNNITLYFKKDDIHLIESIVNKIYCTIPYHSMRDILLYQGKVFSNYIIKNISTTQDGIITENNVNGTPTILIDSEDYNVNDFTLLKFNTAEDTVITNIGNIVDTEMYYNLHHILNQFYRNLMITRSTLLTMNDDEQVYVSSDAPVETNGHLWIQLLSDTNFTFNDIAGLDTTELKDLINEESTKDVSDYTKSLNVLKAMSSNALSNVYYGKTAPVDIQTDDIWVQYLSAIESNVCYSDDTTLVIQMNEKLYVMEFDNDTDTLLQFDTSKFECYAFDDILLNFHGKLYVKYLSILVDLLNSNVITKNDITIFYQRMITTGDNVDPKLSRLYTNLSYIVTLADTSSDLSVLYSTNIRRFHLSYTEANQLEQGSFYTMCIDFSDRDFTFIKDRMLLFINGEYVNPNNIIELSPNKIQLREMKSIISVVDILYNDNEDALIRIKKNCNQHWTLDTTTHSPDNIKDFKHMEPIDVQTYTKKGYYDILLYDYIFNGKLLGMIEYLESHPEEYNDYRNTFIEKFQKISDLAYDSSDISTAKIIIPTMNNKTDVPYEIKSKYIPNLSTDSGKLYLSKNLTTKLTSFTNWLIGDKGIATGNGPVIIKADKAGFNLEDGTFIQLSAANFEMNSNGGWVKPQLACTSVGTVFAPMSNSFKFPGVNRWFGWLNDGYFKTDSGVSVPYCSIFNSAIFNRANRPVSARNPNAAWDGINYDGYSYTWAVFESYLVPCWYEPYKSGTYLYSDGTYFTLQSLGLTISETGGITLNPTQLIDVPDTSDMIEDANISLNAGILNNGTLETLTANIWNNVKNNNLVVTKTVDYNSFNNVVANSDDIGIITAAFLNSIGLPTTLNNVTNMSDFTIEINKLLTAYLAANNINKSITNWFNF